MIETGERPEFSSKQNVSSIADRGINRRRFIKSAAAATLAGGAMLVAPVVHGSNKNGVRIGVVLPLTGNLSLFGQQAQLGIELACAEINETGGILGQPIHIDYHDDMATPSMAESAARTLTEDTRVLAIVGPITSASRNAISPIMNASGTPLLYATDYEGGDCGSTLFYFNSVPNQVVTPLLNYLLDTTEGSIFMLGADYIWPARMFDSCANIIADRNRIVAGRRFIPLNGLSDYTPIINEIRSSGASIILLALPGTPHENFIAAADNAGLFPSLTVGLLDTVALYTRSEQSAESIKAFGCVPFVITDPSAGARNFVERARGMAGANAVVSAYVVTHYNAIMALKAGCERAGSLSRSAAISGMSGLHYATPTGELYLDAATRHTTLQMYLVEVGMQQLRMVQSPEVIEPEAACVAGA